MTLDPAAALAVKEETLAGLATSIVQRFLETLPDDYRAVLMLSGVVVCEPKPCSNVADCSCDDQPHTRTRKD